MARTKTRIFPTGNRRLKPPEHLSDPGKTIFRQLVRAVAADHFAEADLPLLEQYSAAISMAREAQAELDKHGPVLVAGKLSPWCAVLEKSQKACVALSMRLRLSPQSRFDRLKAGTTNRPQPLPWDDPDGLLAGFPEDEDENPFAKNGKPLTGLVSFRR